MLLELKGVPGLGVKEQSGCRLWQAPRLGVGLLPPLPLTSRAAAGTLLGVCTGGPWLALGVSSTNQQPRPCSTDLDLGLNPAGPLPPLVLAHASCNKVVRYLDLVVVAKGLLGSKLI